MNKLRILEWCCRIFVGLIFIWAGYQKFGVTCEFARDIYNYHMAPGTLINLAAIILPVLEMVLGACLIIGIAPRGAALGLSFILVFFVIVLGINYFRGVEFSCGCFGTAEDDWCQILANNYKSDNPGITTAEFMKVRTGCDIIRDIIFLIPSLVAFILLRKRLDRPKLKFKL